MMSTPPVLSSATDVATSGMARKMTYLNAGLPRQCSSNASSRMYWSRFHSTSFQGPVPTAAVLPNASSPDLLDVLLRHDREEHEPLEQEREGLVGDEMDGVRR